MRLPLIGPKCTKIYNPWDLPKIGGSKITPFLMGDSGELILGCPSSGDRQIKRVIPIFVSNEDFSLNWPWINLGPISLLPLANEMQHKMRGLVSKLIDLGRFKM